MVAYSWNILRFGVCEACGRGPDDGWGHLCRGRWAALRRATAPAMPLDRLPSRARLGAMSEAALRRLGRLPIPLLAREGEFQELSWDDAVKLAALRLGGGGRLAVGRPLSLEAEAVVGRFRERLPPGEARIVLGRSDAGAAPFRVHCVEFLDPAAVATGADEVLLLPVQSRHASSGGTCWRGPGTLRFSPEILGNPVPSARPDWAVLAAIGAAWGPDPLLSAPHVGALRAAIVAEDPGLAGLDTLAAPGDRLAWGGAIDGGAEPPPS